MAKTTLLPPIANCSLVNVKPGEFFRMANGRDADTPYLAVRWDKQPYNNVLLARNLNTGEWRKMWITNKTRLVVLLELVSATFRDVNLPSPAGDPALNATDDKED